jgi:hypothetical protein
MAEALEIAGLIAVSQSETDGDCPRMAINRSPPNGLNP